MLCKPKANTMYFKPLSFILLLAATITACRPVAEKEKVSMHEYKIENFFGQNKIDTLLTDMVTFIGVKPRPATSQTRFEAQFRPYYIEYANQFSIIYFFVNEQGEHFYYLIRPARTVQGDLRGVGGRFRMAQNKIEDFEEIFNTPVFDREKLIEIGAELFSEMIETGNVDRYLGNPLYIEWPDERLKYHKGLNEWRYDVEP